ncbi:MAG: hypothetical protein IJ775_03015 [Muribaculaceae bacterium]|nr:hypothetical protein [Muribaculaceae bacterium]
MKELNDDEIRIIGDDIESPKRPSSRKWLIMLVMALIVAALIALLFMSRHMADAPERVLFDSSTVEQAQMPTSLPQQLIDDDTITGITLRDTTVNDIPLSIFTPHRLTPRLHVGELRNRLADPTIVMALQAADIRADNQEIVSAFVLNGQTLSRGKAKLGFCAIIDGRITLGVDDATPLYEQAVEHGGDFFRQYPLVQRHAIVENNIKNKALRRALALIDGRIVVVTTGSSESLHDFAQALVDIGAETAINLVGGKLYSGWVQATDTIVQPDDHLVHTPTPQNINYIVWTK